MSHVAPVPVIPYANAMGYDRARLLHHAVRHGVAAVALTAFYVPVWLSGRSVFGHYFANVWDDCFLPKTLVPLVQAVFIGAGLALTFAARSTGSLYHSRPKYLVALMLNVLAVACLALDLSGALSPPRVYARWISLSYPLCVIPDA